MRPDGSSLGKLAAFVGTIETLLDRAGSERDILVEGARQLAKLIADDDWLPPLYAQPDPGRYRQYLLHRDARARFSVVSFVWGPGQATPIHDHTVWGLIGILRGAELSERYERTPAGLRSIGRNRLNAGDVDAVSPTIGDLHRVSNALADAVSVSIHVYGADIGTVARATYDAAGAATPFVSGYADAPPPLLAEVAA